ncbi:Astacin-like metalloendopeptidase, partial, partial [Pelobates cultripes]
MNTATRTPMDSVHLWRQDTAGLTDSIPHTQNLEDITCIIGQLLDGDIAPRLTPARGVIICSNCFWTEFKNGRFIVPYVFSPEFSWDDLTKIKDGFSQFELLTCLTFVERTTEEDYLEILSGNGSRCWSKVGKEGGRQYLSLLLNAYGIKGDSVLQ